MLLLLSILALQLKFGEDDFSLQEQDGSLKVPVTATGELSGTITIQVVPMTTTQFLKQGLTPVPDTLNDPNVDPAEAGMNQMHVSCSGHVNYGCSSYAAR